MKRYILLCSVAVAFLFSACSDEFLDKKPLTTLSEDDVFSNAALLED